MSAAAAQPVVSPAGQDELPQQRPAAGRSVQLVHSTPLTHQHSWQLRSVDFDEGAVVREYECQGCTAVWFA